MAAWPSTLPTRALMSSYAGEQKDNVIETKIPAGQDKLRKRFSAVTTKYNVGFWLSSDQVDTLMTFYGSYCASTWDWTHPRTGSAATCRFRSKPKEGKRQGNYFSVTFVVEVTA